MKIVVLDKDTLGDDIDLGCFDKFGVVKMYPYTDANDTLDRVKDADVVISNKVVIDKNIMEKSNIKLICVAATGMNNIDLKSAEQKGIVVKNVAGYSTPSVVQTTFSLLFYLIGKLKYLDEYTKSDTGWVQSKIFTHLDNPYFDISGKKWGIIGLGEIGKKVALAAKSFGCEIIYYSTSGQNRNQDFQRSNLENLLSESDIITIHAPLNDKTYNLINENNLKLLKENAILLNLGRGGIINEADLAKHIDKSQIQVGLDVLEKEPICHDNPLLSVQDKDRLVITPHIAWASKESRERLVKGICQNIKMYIGE